MKGVPMTYRSSGPRKFIMFGPSPGETSVTETSTQQRIDELEARIAELEAHQSKPTKR
jgi:hypothetical protein